MSQGKIQVAPQYVGYLRVSTRRQGESGLGLAGQAHAIENYVARLGGTLISTFTEVESGARSNRPILHSALAKCRETGAILTVAKLDRLARNAAFVGALLESSIEFCAVDMPDANRLMMQVVAAIAEYERDLMSKRLKSAFAIARSQGRKFGFALMSDRERDLVMKKGQDGGTRRRSLTRSLSCPTSGLFSGMALRVMLISPTP